VTIEYQLDAKGHRGTKAVKRLVEYAPASGGLALWMQHRDADQPPHGATWAFNNNQRRWIIANDGTTIYYGSHFEQFTINVQTGLVAHQVLHVALRHVDREKALRERLGSVDSELFCVCADAIVNSSLSHLQWLELPPGSVTLDKLLLHVLGIEEPIDVSLHQWNTESLYRAIDDREWQGSPTGQSESRTQHDGTSNKAQDGSEIPGSAASGNSHGQRQRPEEASSIAIDGSRSCAARELAAGTIRDLLSNSDTAPETYAEQSRQWSERLLRAHTSDADQSLMRQLLADNKSLKTPWELLLRTRLQRALAQTVDISWSRPTRSWLANRGRTTSGKRMPWQPGLSSTRDSPRLCVMVDVSGSVDNSLMQRFASELERIMRVMRSEVHLIVGDSQVRYQTRLKAGVNTIRDIEFTGGGGTDFAPMITAADKLRPDLGVLLTDLDGPAGEAPRWPILWVVPENAAFRQAPFGQRLVLE
jgi:predicted metal-dependent peptidase